MTTPETFAITQVPTNEIARQLARLDRAKFALHNAHTQPEDGEIAWKLARPAGTEDPYLESYWAQPARRAASYDRLLIDSLKLALNLKAVTNAAARSYKPIDIRQAPPATLAGETRELGRAIYDQARVEALGRLGMLEILRSHVAVPRGVLAALHYQRANIRSDIDRTLYERVEVIDARTELVLSQVPKREVEVTVLTGTSQKGLGHRQVMISVFSAAETDAAWWQELAHDLSRIDEVSAAAEADE